MFLEFPKEMRRVSDPWVLFYESARGANTRLMPFAYTRIVGCTIVDGRVSIIAGHENTVVSYDPDTEEMTVLLEAPGRPKYVGGEVYTVKNNRLPRCDEVWHASLSEPITTCNTREDEDVIARPLALTEQGPLIWATNMGRNDHSHTLVLGDQRRVVHYPGEKGVGLPSYWPRRKLVCQVFRHTASGGLTSRCHSTKPRQFGELVRSSTRKLEFKPR